MGHSHLKLPIWLMQTPFVQMAGISLHSSISARRQTSLSIPGEGSGEESIPHSQETAALLQFKKKRQERAAKRSSSWRIDPGSCRSRQARAALRRSGYTTDPHNAPSRKEPRGLLVEPARHVVGRILPRPSTLFSLSVSAVSRTLAQALGPGCKWEVPGGSLKY